MATDVRSDLVKCLRIVPIYLPYSAPVSFPKPVTLFAAHGPPRFPI